MKAPPGKAPLGGHFVQRSIGQDRTCLPKRVAPQPVGLERLRRDFWNRPPCFDWLHRLDLRGCRVDERFRFPTNNTVRPTKRALRFAHRFGRLVVMLFVVFTLVLGMGNFAWHRAVIESGHRMVSDIPPDSLRVMRFLSLSLEFALLCGALYAVRLGHTHWLWAYLGYSAINAGAAWMIIKGRI